MNQISLSEIIPEKKENNKNLKLKILSCIIAGLLVSISAAYYFFKPSYKPTLDQRYLQLTVVDANGYSVAGASVYINSNLEGLTDSFGQLRKSFNLFSDAKLDIKIEKKKLQSSKTIDLKDYKADIQTSMSI